MMICKPSMKNHFDDALVLDDDINIDDGGEPFKLQYKMMLF